MLFVKDYDGLVCAEYHGCRIYADNKNNKGYVYVIGAGGFEYKLCSSIDINMAKELASCIYDAKDIGSTMFSVKIWIDKYNKNISAA